MVHHIRVRGVAIVLTENLGEIDGHLTDDDEREIRSSIYGSSGTRVEVAWARHMLQQGWLASGFEDGLLTITANPGTVHEYRRRLDIQPWLATLKSPGTPQLEWAPDGPRLVVECGGERIGIDVVQVLWGMPAWMSTLDH